mmetsp:Transcript_35474/g.73879  ORF Transcript_35474/g.73879 Transcript_35474/m.73879 type:complete len:184 (-) Transcript_35474:301-852(-)
MTRHAFTFTKAALGATILTCSSSSSHAFQIASLPLHQTAVTNFHPFDRQSRTKLNSISLDGLMDMDVVIFKENGEESDKKFIGAVQEDGTLLPLSAWSDEPAFGNSIELLVDEEDRNGGLDTESITIESIVPEESLSYGSRQVGGGKGPGNPHGEESELLYYVDQDLLQDIEVVIKPELEILW